MLPRIVLQRHCLVVAVRMVAQLAGGSGYSSAVEATLTIVREDGLAGFFGGLLPSVCRETAYAIMIPMALHLFARSIAAIFVVSPQYGTNARSEKTPTSLTVRHVLLPGQ